MKQNAKPESLTPEAIDAFNERMLSFPKPEPGRSEMLDLLGLPSHPGLQGVSLIAKEPDPLRSRYLVAQTPLAHQYAVVRGRHKLLYDVRHDKVMLVDLESDPGEQQSLVHENPALTAELLRRLGTWRRHQVDYYDDLSRHRRFYPPHLAD